MLSDGRMIICEGYDESEMGVEYIRGPQVERKSDPDAFGKIDRELEAFTDIYYYEEGMIRSAGRIPICAAELQVNESGLIGKKRAETVQTWFRPAQYIFSSDYSGGAEKGDQLPSLPMRIVELPSGLYPMGTTVRLKKDLEVYNTADENGIPIQLKKGMYLCLTGCDDQQWLYVSLPFQPLKPLKLENGTNVTGGWLRLSPANPFAVQSHDGEIDCMDLFEGLSSAG